MVARYQGVKENGEWLLTGYGVSFWGDKNILQLGSGDGCTT